MNELKVPDGWKLVCVNEHFDALIAAMERAEGKGYLPDAMAEEWANFECDENVSAIRAVAPQAGATVGEKSPSAFGQLKAALAADAEYAWAWHCNLAMPIMDSLHCTSKGANKAGADLMQYLFGIDIRKHEYWNHD